MKAFDKYVSPEPMSGCWLWTGTINEEGYGRHWSQTLCRRTMAHRTSWELANKRKIPVGMQICHRCDNPSCVNPGHLFVGTARDNSRDMVRKGRAAGKTGRQKLNADSVLAISERVTLGETYESIAKLFGISASMVGHVILRVRYGDHVLNPDSV